MRVLALAPLTLLVWVLVAEAGVVEAHGQRERRDFRALSDDQVNAIAALDPPEWDSVDSGHLAKLLVPRVCELQLDC
jgi:hypothetical protein